MSTSEITLLGGLGCMVIMMTIIIFWRLKVSRQMRDELAQLRAVAGYYEVLDERFREQTEEIKYLHASNASLEAQLDLAKTASEEKLELLMQAEKRLKTEFENLAHRIFDDSGKALTEQNRERMAALLDPLKEQLGAFRTRVDEVHSQDTQNSATLMAQVRQLQELSNQVSDDANNLAKAIQGGAKKQGDWGEVIVERIFEASGLEKGREYDTQVSIRNRDGDLQRPDFMVYLPGDKVVIVDAKVSLTAYERWSSAEDESKKDQALQDHLRSVRTHVKTLQEKDYTEALGNRTLDFVILCIPIEPAFQAALQQDESLIYDLAKTNVVITGPATLMITIKLIAQVWRRENENKHAEIIADRAGRLYDQVSLIAESLLDTQKRMQDASNSLNTAVKRLHTGKGNLATRIEELRTLGAKIHKPLPPEMTETQKSDTET